MTIAESAADKLSPARLSTSGKMTAILAFLCGEEWTDPSITELCITSDGLVMAATTHDPFFDEIVGDAGDLERNVKGAADAVELTSAERSWLVGRMKTMVQDWRR